MRRKSRVVWGTPEDQRAFGQLIRDARIFEKMSQEGLAEVIGVSASYVSQIETGRRLPSWEITRAIAVALHLSARDVLIDRFKLVCPNEEVAQWIEAFRGYSERSPRRSPAFQKFLRRLRSFPSPVVERLAEIFLDDLSHAERRHATITKLLADLPSLATEEAQA